MKSRLTPYVRPHFVADLNKKTPNLFEARQVVRLNIVHELVAIDNDGMYNELGHFLSVLK